MALVLMLDNFVDAYGMSHNFDDDMQRCLQAAVSWHVRDRSDSDRGAVIISRQAGKING
jgi:hypothetical protein